MAGGELGGERGQRDRVRRGGGDGGAQLLGVLLVLGAREPLQRAQREEGGTLLLLRRHVQLDQQLRARVVAALLRPAQRVLPAVGRRRVGAHAGEQPHHLRER